MNDLSNVVFPTIPTVAEFIDPTVTEAGFKDALKRLIEYIETLEQKSNFDKKYNSVSKDLLNEINALKALTSVYFDRQNTYPFNVVGRYFKTGESDRSKNFDIHTVNYVNTGLIYLDQGATISASILQQNRNNFSDVASLLVFDMDLKLVADLSIPNTGPEEVEEVQYRYTAPFNCYCVATTIHYAGSLYPTRFATVTGNHYQLTVLDRSSYFDRYIVRMIANLRYANAKMVSEGKTITFEFNELGRYYDNGTHDLNGGGDIYTNAYRNTGLIPLEVGDQIKATVLNPDSNVSAMVIFDKDLNFLESFKNTEQPGDSYPFEYSYTATKRCFIVFCSVNPANRAYISGLKLKADLIPAGTDQNLSWSRPQENVFVRDDNLARLAAEKIEEKIPFLAPGTGYTAAGIEFNQNVSPEYWSAYKSTGKIAVKHGDTFEAVVDTDEPSGVMSVLNLYDYNGNFIRCVHSIPDFGSQGIKSAKINYTCDHEGYITITSIHRDIPNLKELSNPYVIKNRTNRFSSKVKSLNTNVVQNTLFTFPKPTSVIQIDIFADKVFPPESKAEGSINCRLKLNVDGVVNESFAQYAVQGSSSAVYPKKNFSFGFFTDESFTTERSIKLGDLIPQQELVWKANWIDATHSRNILCNRLWEEMVQSRNGFPKREVDRAYLNQLGVKSLDTGAIGHVDGYPAVVRLNGVFYGIGTLNIGKKRDNYNLDKSNKKHVQFELLGGGIDFTASAPPYEKLGLRNPKLSGYEEGGPISDATVKASMQALWDFHRLPIAERTAQFDKYYDRTNVVDWYLLVEFTAAADLLDKNSILTTWDGTQYCWMPYDLDTTFGLHWAGIGVEYASNWNWDANNIIPVVKPIILNDVIKRYADLRNKGIFSLNTVYRIERDIESKFSIDLFKQEQQRWPDIPSKDLGGICQIMAWLKERIKYLDAKYGYLDQGVLAQKLWNPPTLAAGASQSTTLNLSTATLGTQYLVDFQFDLKGTQMTAECKSAGVVTVTHVNNSGEQVNLDEGALRLIV